MVKHEMSNEDLQSAINESLEHYRKAEDDDAWLGDQISTHIEELLKIQRQRAGVVFLEDERSS